MEKLRKCAWKGRGAQDPHECDVQGLQALYSGR